MTAAARPVLALLLLLAAACAAPGETAPGETAAEAEALKRAEKLLQLHHRDPEAVERADRWLEQMHAREAEAGAERKRAEVLP